MIDIRTAESAFDFATARALFREYADGLGIDLSFQGFDTELVSLPGKYAPPEGRLLLAWMGENAVGCIAARRIDAISCEMKRLYVQPRARGERLGQRLVERICDEARDAGYSRICLDTLPTMAAAQSLYLTSGFRPIEAYVFNPIVGTVFLARDL